ncbi:MAG: protein translocase subunit SecD [Patescibacteria group bacterium]|nr:protein translocase subunit SecD [Patescibacteria group bacterium]MCL5431483.1 protein translocase subunit SecD [Patescibacteria group bacterium]
MNNRFLIGIIVLITAIAVYFDLPTNATIFKHELPTPSFFGRVLELKKGLDLAGGTRLVLQADMSQVNSADRDTALESLKGIIERRVNLFGVSEPVVQSSKSGNDYRVIVELAGITDVNQAIDLVGKTANLTFREEVSASESANISTISAQLYGPYQKLTDLSGKDLKLAKPAFQSSTNEPIIQLTFNAEGTKKFADITTRDVGKHLAIFLDDQLLMAPTIQSAITDGQPVISGNFTTAQTKEYSILLNSGALPAPVHVIEQRTIGATLGQDSINKSLLAGTVGLTIVALFMIANYGRLGIFADLALMIYSLVVLAIFKLIPVTLTLAGIAGFILSIGMAVDANILIFERMKEEIRWGRSKIAAIELGFARAFPSIRDSNASSLITCAILFYFGTGSVRGFAVTLAIGIIVSLFTAVTVTRTLLRTFNKIQ